MDSLVRVGQGEEKTIRVDKSGQYVVELVGEGAHPEELLLAPVVCVHASQGRVYGAGAEIYEN